MNYQVDLINAEELFYKDSERKGYHVTIGSDPEYMLYDKINNRIVSAIDVLKGSHNKKNPIDLGDGFKMYYENTLLEGIIPPASTQSDFIENFTIFEAKVEDYFNSLDRLIDSGQYILARNTCFHEFSEVECSHPEARRGSCQAELCAYTQRIYHIAEFANNYRCAGGHIHIGRSDYKNFRQETLKDDQDAWLMNTASCINFVKYLDYYLSIPSITYDWEQNNLLQSIQRRSMGYGKAGRFRITPYGIEYRVLPSFWAQHGIYRHFVWKHIFRAIVAHQSNVPLPIESEEIQQVIDIGDIKKAENLVHQDKNLRFG